MRNPTLFDANRHPCCTALLAIVVAATALSFFTHLLSAQHSLNPRKTKDPDPESLICFNRCRSALQTIIPGLKAQGS